MYIKRSTIALFLVIVIALTAVGTVMLINPFGILQFDDFFKLNKGVSVLKSYFYEDVENKTIVDGALLGASYSVEDPYTVYMGVEEANSFLETVESDDYTGIGLYITNDPEDGCVTVVSPLVGTPAEKAGIASGDKILEIDGVEVSGENIDAVAANLKGKAGTTVSLKVLKKESGETKDIVLEREKIRRETVSSKMLNNETGYVQITQFGVNTYDEFAEQFNKLVDSGMKQLVMDLRNNSGGYVDIAVQIADTFIDKGNIVYTMDKSGRKREYKAEKGAIDIPIVAVTNGGSASASEILVGALKDYSIAKSVGEKTFGKGVTQLPYQFTDGSIMKVTDSRYYTPSGVCIDKEGIEPDVEVKLDLEKYASISELSFSEDEQLKMAVEILEKK